MSHVTLAQRYQGGDGICSLWSGASCIIQIRRFGACKIHALNDITLLSGLINMAL